MIGPVADEADFGLEADVILVEDGLLDVMDEADHIVGGGAAGVDDKAGVLGRNLSAADAVTLEAGLDDEGAGVVTGGPLKGGAGTCELKRLAAGAAFGEV